MILNFILIALAPGIAYSADVVASSAKIYWKGFTDGKTAVSFTKQLDVSSTKNITGLVLDAQNLTGSNGIVLDASNIKYVATQVNLTANNSVPVAISVGGLTKPGKYTGSLALRAPDESTGATIDLIGKPVVILGTDGLTAFSCLIPLSCAWAAKWMGVRQAITVDNSKGIGDASMGQPSTALRANRGDCVLNETDLAAHAPNSNPLAAGKSGIIRLIIPSNLPAGRYQGPMVLPVANADDPVTASITLDVKQGPWIALVVLLIGIIIGRLVQSMNTSQAQAQQRLLTALSSLQSAESDLTDPGFLAVIDRLIGSTREAVREMIRTETDISQDLVNISAAIDLAKNLERLTAIAAGLSPNAKVAAEQHLQNARTAFLGEDFKTAATERGAAQQAILDATEPAPIVAAKTAFTRLEFQFAGPTTAPAAPVPRPMHLRLLQSFAGTQPAGPQEKVCLR